MNVDVRVDRELDHATVALSGPFDLAHSSEVVGAVQSVEAHLNGCHSAEVSLKRVNRIDGTGAVLLARLLERLLKNGCRTEIAASDNAEVARLLSLYRRVKTDWTEDVCAENPMEHYPGEWIGMPRAARSEF